jgi:hypothetical protein
LAWVFQAAWGQGQLCQASVSINDDLNLISTIYCDYGVLIFVTVFPGFQLLVVLVWLSGLLWGDPFQTIFHVCINHLHIPFRYNLLRKKFPATSFTGSPVLSDSGFDLLNKLLTYDPEKVNY